MNWTLVAHIINTQVSDLFGTMSEYERKRGEKDPGKRTLERTRTGDVNIVSGGRDVEAVLQLPAHTLRLAAQRKYALLLDDARLSEDIHRLVREAEADDHPSRSARNQSEV